MQQPLTDNKNEYSSDLYQQFDESGLTGFQTTNQFKRQGDVFVRLTYPAMDTDRLDISVSLLPIYHLAEDTYVDANNVEQYIVGSDGLTLNGNLFFDYSLNESSALKLSLASPFIVREVRPGGLTRSFLANLQYAFKF